jgi:hypothetical protein
LDRYEREDSGDGQCLKWEASVGVRVSGGYPLTSPAPRDRMTPAPLPSFIPAARSSSSEMVCTFTPLRGMNVDRTALSPKNSLRRVTCEPPVYEPHTAPPTAETLTMGECSTDPVCGPTASIPRSTSSVLRPPQQTSPLPLHPRHPRMPRLGRWGRKRSSCVCCEILYLFLEQRNTGALARTEQHQLEREQAPCGSVCDSMVLARCLQRRRRARSRRRSPRRTGVWAISEPALLPGQCSL